MPREEWENDEEWRDFVHHVRENAVSQIADSAVVMSIYPEDPDIKYAVELGLSVMYDKPIVLIVDPERAKKGIPEKLKLIADRIVTLDIDTGEGRDELSAVLKEMGLGKE